MRMIKAFATNACTVDDTRNVIVNKISLSKRKALTRELEDMMTATYLIVIAVERTVEQTVASTVKR